MADMLPSSKHPVSRNTATRATSRPHRVSKHPVSKHRGPLRSPSPNRSMLPNRQLQHKAAKSLPISRSDLNHGIL